VSQERITGSNLSPAEEMDAITSPGERQVPPVLEVGVAIGHCLLSRFHIWISSSVAIPSQPVGENWTQVTCAPHETGSSLPCQDVVSHKMTRRSYDPLARTPPSGEPSKVTTRCVTLR
jgi:hypothetical protein